ncbi:MAG: DUF3124 domain-containing protein [Bacteroidales bacterium]|nr:DUF3124 domain-containing protein [Bacteroidales bacterium]
MKKTVLLYLSLFLLIMLMACNSTKDKQTQAVGMSGDYLEVSSEVFSNLLLVKGELIYVPVYSDIYGTDVNKKIKLSATLSIRNTDMQNQIIVSIVDYYDTHGKKIRNYLESPVKLKPLQTVSYLVPYNEAEGGVGANFIVEWVSEQEVSEPVVEAVMIGTSSSLGISFVCQGKVLKYISE